MGHVFCFFLLQPQLWYLEVPSLGLELEPQLPAYTTGTAMPDPSLDCNLHHNSRQRWLFNPLSEARDQNHILMDTSRVHNPLSHNGNSRLIADFKLLTWFALGCIFPLSSLNFQLKSVRGSGVVAVAL